ncbi:MAG: helix-turn-helix transcriptional regulator [Roseivivax sp.]|nr:helix-turn-helix transcriptional regulator [Roseivivax sp.]
MKTILDKRARAALFRTRLRQAMTGAEMTQSALAREAGVDRSTVSQLLAEDGPRLPNAHVVGSCAAALGVSADWLLGLSDHPESAQALLASAMEMTDAPRALIDEQIFAWHRQAAGYKIRFVPATLPDILKTRAVLEWEYAPHLGRTAEQAINAATDRLNWMRESPSDYEIALPLHEMASMARGEGYYAGLPLPARQEQLDRMETLCRQLYPRLRVYMFDAKRVFSAGMTIFGPLLAAVYIGRTYIVFRDSERIRTLTAHVDALIREAEVTARQTPDVIAELRAGLSSQ